MIRNLKIFIALLFIIAVLFLTQTASFAEQNHWDCPECGRTGNTGKYCGGCAHPAPWMSQPDIGDYEYIVNSDGTATITAYNGSGGDIVLPVKIGDYSVVKIGYRAFLYKTGLTSVIIPDGIQIIDKDAFAGCNQLSHIELPSTLTTISGDSAFQNVPITEITLPGSLETIEDNPFSMCLELSKININDSPSFVINNNALYTSDLKRLIAYPLGLTASYYEVPLGTETLSGWSFRGNRYIKEIVIPEGVTTIGMCSFYGDTVLTKITLPNSLVSIGNSAFFGCTNLTIYCHENSEAYHFAIDNDIPYQII